MTGFRSAAASGNRARAWLGSQWRARRVRRLLYGLAVAVVLFALLGFFAVPPILKGYLVRTLSEKLHRPVTVRTVRFNPFTLTATLAGCDIKDRDGVSPFLSFDSLTLGASLRSIPDRGAVLDELVLKGLRLAIVRHRDGSYNFSDLLKPRTSSRPLRYSLNNIRVLGAAITFDDRPKGARHEVTDLDLGIPFLSDLPSNVNIYTDPSLSAKVDGRPVELRGRSKPFSHNRETFLSLDMSGLDLARYLPYLPADLGFRVQSGSLSTTLKLTFLNDVRGHRKLILSGRATLADLVVNQRDGAPLARLPHVGFNLGSVDLLTLKGVVTSIRLQSPELYLSRDGRGVWNFANLGPASPAAPAPKAPAASKAAVNVLLGEVALSGGTIHFDDEAVRPAFKATLSSLDLTVQNLDTALQRPAEVNLALKTDQGEGLKASATLAFSPLTAKGQIETNGLRLVRYAPYDRDLLPFEVEDGRLSLSGNYAFSAAGGADAIQLTEGAATATGLRLRLPGEKVDFLDLPSATASGLSFDTAASKAGIASLEAAGGSLRAVRAADGSLDLARLTSGAPAPAQTPAAQPASSPAPAPAASPSWTVSLGALAWKGFALRAEDRSLREPASFDFPAVTLTAQGLSTAPNQAGSLTLQAAMKPSGSLSLSGPVTLSPFSLAWDVGLNHLALLPFEPYLTGELAIDLTDGNASAKGKVAVSLPADKPLQASFAGRARVDDLATVDRVSLEKFVNWKSLQLGGIKAQADPPSLTMASVALSDFYARIIVSPQGKLNLFQVLHPAPPAAQPGAPGTVPPVQPGGPEGKMAFVQPGGPGGGEPKQAYPAPAQSVVPAPTAATETAPKELVEIPAITLSGGTIDYTDHFIKPNYSAKLTEVVGSLTGLSSRPGTRADLKLSAHLEHQAPIEVTGQINPLVKPPYADIKGKVTDVELSPLSPYSGRYAGYLIDKGKLNMDVSYHVENNHLDAKNHLFLDQLTFGSKVDSPEATKLPVRLAVALLKDRQGNIDLHIPVSGSLNDPKFKLGPIILKIILNILVKAATAPFALLGHLFGHGESLSYLTFAPGSATLDPAALQKVQQLETALYDHPGLKLDITGRVDPTADREGLRRAFVEREIKAQRFKELLKKGQAPASVDAVQLTPKEYSEYLFEAYKHVKFPKARTLIGTVKRLPDDEMKRLLLLHTSVTDEELKQLAIARAQAVKDALLKSGKVPAERVFLAAQGAASEEAKKAGLSRVDFTLK